MGNTWPVKEAVLIIIMINHNNNCNEETKIIIKDSDLLVLLPNYGMNYDQLNQI